MPPSSTLPRLADLNPVAVARNVVQTVSDHLARQVLRLSPCAKLDLQYPDGAEHCDLGVTVQDLVRWAQTGEGNAEEAWDAAQEVCGALYSQAGAPGTFGIGELGLGDAAGDAATPIGVVLLATTARRCITRGEDVAPRWLAALAGLAKRRVNQLAGEGELKRRRSTGPRGRTAIPARDASRLLASRIVGDNARALDTLGAAVRYCSVDRKRWLVIDGSDLALAALATTNGWERAGDTWIARAVDFPLTSGKDAIA